MFSIFSALFWGIFLLASGAILLLKYALKLQVSGGRLIFGLFILMMGLSLLTNNVGWSGFKTDNGNVIVFTSGQQVAAEGGKEYTVIFGSANYDLSDLEQGSYVKVNSIFGSCGVNLPKGPVQVSADSAFGSVRLPNGDVSFGNLPYSTDGENKTTVEISNVFGSVTASD